MTDHLQIMLTICWRHASCLRAPLDPAMKVLAASTSHDLMFVLFARACGLSDQEPLRLGPLEQDEQLRHRFSQHNSVHKAQTKTEHFFQLWCTDNLWLSDFAVNLISLACTESGCRASPDFLEPARCTAHIRDGLSRTLTALPDMPSTVDAL